MFRLPPPRVGDGEKADRNVLADSMIVPSAAADRNKRNALITRILRRLPHACVPIRPAYSALLSAAWREVRT